MTNIFTVKDRFTPNKGMSSDAIFLKGPTRFVNRVVKMLGDRPVNVLKGNKELTLWDFDCIRHCDEVVLYFDKTIGKENIVLLCSAFWSQFHRETVVYIDGEDLIRDFIEIVNENPRLYCDIILFDDVKKMVTHLDETLDYFGDEPFKDEYEEAEPVKKKSGRPKQSKPVKDKDLGDYFDELTT